MIFAIVKEGKKSDKVVEKLGKNGHPWPKSHQEQYARSCGWGWMIIEGLMSGLHWKKYFQFPGSWLESETLVTLLLLYLLGVTLCYIIQVQLMSGSV